MSESIGNPEQLTQALRAWAERNEIRPPEFAKAMGYSYNYAYQLLRGNALVSADTLGRIVLAYGAKAAEEIAQQASGKTPPTEDLETE